MSNKAEILSFGFAENALAGPIECIRHVFQEMIKVGHTVQIYTYFNKEEHPEIIKDLAEFVKKLDIPEITEFIPRADCIAEIYYDEKCFGQMPGFWNFFGSMMRAEIILPTSQNAMLMKDQGYWNTGKISSGIITESNPGTPKIIGLHD